MSMELRVNYQMANKSTVKQRKIYLALNQPSKSDKNVITVEGQTPVENLIQVSPPDLPNIPDSTRRKALCESVPSADDKYN